MKLTLTLFIFCYCCFAFSQTNTSNFRTKRIAVKDSIKIDSVSINKNTFSIKTKGGTRIDSSFYDIDFSKAILIFKKPIDTDTVIIDYLRFPKFLTKTYRQLNSEIIVENTNNLNKLYKLSQSNTTKKFNPFQGLTTSGSISRGVTIGSNQNSVLNSELDLQIIGKLSEKVSLRASIQDANIPLQESGFSQRLDEFDQVFIELFSESWNIRAGDIDLLKTNSIFGNFSKRVQGLNINALLDHKNSKTNLFASGALVRGQFNRSQFIAQEGNQGPYKLLGPNGESFVLIVSGSEIVYVNGVVVERGENKDYVIDYNAGEIIFNSTFPITSEMRIIVDYQFSDRNFSRFIVYGGASHESSKLNITASVYSESDSRNQPLQQNLSESQIEILSNAGDDRDLMVAQSAIAESFDENRILYRRDIFNGQEIFVFSNNPDDELFGVQFTQVGQNNGNYIASNTNAITTIFEFVPPINGIPQGNFEPIIQLIAPIRLQLAVVNGNYKPTEKTLINFELAGSSNDLNLFSGLDDTNNEGLAGNLEVIQSIKNDSVWNLSAFANANFLQQDFRTIEQLYNPEFNRDWNVENPLGNQLLSVAGLNFNHSRRGNATYQFQHLNYSENFNGNRHILGANLLFDKLRVSSNSSFLSARSSINESTFLRSYNKVTYNLKKAWFGARVDIEANEQRNRSTDSLTALSQRFTSYNAFVGYGDSTKVFVKVGYKNRVNDSIRGNSLERVNTSNTFYLESKLLQTGSTNLSLYVNYRDLRFEDGNTQAEQSLNSRLQYSQQLFKKLILWNTVFETNSGTLPQQEFTFVEVEPGQGTFQFIDFNGNGIRELDEFEIAQFQDQANFIQVFLPNQIFIQTHQNRLSQILTINPQIWNNSESKSKKFWSHFYNQTSYLIDRRIRRDGDNFNLNPFNADADNQLGLQLNIRNVLFYNRGKQRYTTSYTFLSNQTRNSLSNGFIENELTSHQLNFNHKFAKSWLFNFSTSFQVTDSNTENFTNRNFSLDQTLINPRLSYFFNDNIRFDVFYQNRFTENTTGVERLNQQNYGTSFTLNSQQKSAITGEFNFFSNDFSGNANTPVGFQLLEGLQPGRNLTWSLIAQKKLTKFLDLNVNYMGRTSESSRTIHTGSVQLRAFF